MHATVQRSRPPGIRQTMAGLHTWVGLLAGWLLYAMFLTGSLSYFRDEISQWMRPEARAVAAADAQGVDRLVAEMQAIAPRAPSWFITLPDARNGSAQVRWRGAAGLEKAAFDPATGRRLELRATRGGDFFYTFHFQLHYLPPLWGRWIAGACAMLMLVAVASGVITHRKIFADFFTFRPGKGQRSWLDAHAAFSVLGLPFHLMVTYTGLVTLMLLYMPWGLQAAYPSAAARADFGSTINSFLPPGPHARVARPLVPVGPLVQRAEQQWAGEKAGRIQVNHPGDAMARVVVTRQDTRRISTRPAYVVFDGASGEILRAVDGGSAAAQTHGVLYGLHMGRFADAVTRWLYVLLSLAGTAMVGTGLVLWTVKRREKLHRPSQPHAGYWLVERLNVAVVAGLPIAVAVFFWANRVLPVAATWREDWEVHLFFIAWAIACVHALARPPAKAWVAQFGAAAVLSALLPMLNAFTTGRGLFASLRAGDWVFASVDLAALAMAALFAALAARVAMAPSRTARAR